MTLLSPSLVRKLHHKRLGNSTAAIAGLISSISVLVGWIAGHYTPRGIHRIFAVVHLHKEPFIVRAAPVIAGVAVAFATAASLLKFYSWYVEHEDDAQPVDVDS